MDTLVRGCVCGAITITYDDYDISMTRATFDKKYPDLEIEDEEAFGNCNHCVNHWGIDLCGCGSGEPVGECSNKYYACLNNIPSQNEETVTERPLWKQ